jgi:hypothetical protein
LKAVLNSCFDVWLVKPGATLSLQFPQLWLSTQIQSTLQLTILGNMVLETISTRQLSYMLEMDSLRTSSSLVTLIQENHVHYRKNIKVQSEKEITWHVKTSLDFFVVYLESVLQSVKTCGAFLKMKCPQVQALCFLNQIILLFHANDQKN